MLCGHKQLTVDIPKKGHVKELMDHVLSWKNKVCIV